jgi:tetratricopeptide (TPR) repeat protein
MPFELKRLPKTSLEAAIAKAAHYRDLNQPEEAESICRDILDVDAQYQQAWALLGLALTDRFRTERVGIVEQAVEAFNHLVDPYQRTYHLGVAWERAAKAHLERDETYNAVTAFEQALDLYAQAEALRPDSPDPLLRWNRCVRLLKSHRGLLTALHAPRGSDPPFGD